MCDFVMYMYIILIGVLCILLNMQSYSIKTQIVVLVLGSPLVQKILE